MKRKIQRTTNTGGIRSNNDFNKNSKSATKSKSLSKRWVDEEIDSGSDSDNDKDDEADDSQNNSKEDEFDEGLETADQKRKRMAMKYLENIQSSSSSHRSRDNDDSNSMDDANEEDDVQYDDVHHTEVSKLLQMEREKLQGKHYKKFDFPSLSVDRLTTRRLSGHKMSITCVALSNDETSAYSGSKDNSVIAWDVETGTKTFLKRYWTPNNNNNSNNSSSNKSSSSSSSSGISSVNSSQGSVQGEILAVAVSHDKKYIASGGRDNIVRIYDTRVKMSEIKAFQGHRDSVTCLSFRKEIQSVTAPTYTLFSGSMDRTLKHWNLNDMAYVETMFGHQEGVLALDCWYKNKPISASNDRTTRIWSIDEENHNLYRTKTSSIECVQYVNGEDDFLTGGQNGTLALWKSRQKKHIFNVLAAHGYENDHGVVYSGNTTTMIHNNNNTTNNNANTNRKTINNNRTTTTAGATTATGGGMTASVSVVTSAPRWICSMSVLKMSDLAVTGSYDGHIKFWKLNNINNTINKNNMRKHRDDNNDDDDDDDTNVSMSPSYQLECPGVINGLAVSRNILVAGVGREHRLGRWWNIKQAQNKLVIIRLPTSND